MEKMNSDGRNNKRKFPFHPKNKRFQPKKRGGLMHRDQFRWNGPSEPESSGFLHPQNYNWTVPPPNIKNNYNGFQGSNFNANYNQPFLNLANQRYNEAPIESEETPLVGPGSETDRMEKILAAKRRIVEALATKSSSASSTEINLQDSSSSKEVNKDKESDKTLRVPNLNNDRIDLRLTNSDFKEIGSVANSKVEESEVEGSDLILNVACSPQQRSFENVSPASAAVPRATEGSSNKPQRVGGWNISALNEIITTEQVVLNPKDKNSSSSTKSSGDIFHQESNEKILGNIQSGSEEQAHVSKAVNSNTKQNQRGGFERIGRLYQSFLKSRLCGYTLKMRDKTASSSGPNPLLDKSVLENQTSSQTQPATQENHVIELEMPIPILIKTDNSEMDDNEQTPEEVSAEEAKEFCQEFSYLLTHPNFLIPPENLERLGLGHLSEMNKLIGERKNDVFQEDSSANQDNFLRVRSLNALNNVTENDIVFNQSSMTSSPASSNFSLDPLSTNNLHSNKMIPPSFPQNFSTNSGHNISVESVAEKVVEQLSDCENASSQSVNANILSLLRRIVSQPNPSEPVLPGPPNLPSTSGINHQPSVQMKNISSKILRLFLIDKQIEDLMLEKMKIYNELLSHQEVSSTLFNSWAQDQIQQGNVMNVVSNTASTVPELGRALQNQVHTHSANKSVPSNPDNMNAILLSNNMNSNSFEEMLSAIQNKSQMDSSEPIDLQQNGLFEPCVPEILEPPDPIFLIPSETNSEINRPKLSVRKDLIDPNSNRNLIITPEVQAPDDTLPPKIKKKKMKNKVQSASPVKKKKKQVFEFVNLIDDTTDEETSGVSGCGSHSRFQTNILDGDPKDSAVSEHPVKKKKFAMVYDLQDTTATRLTTLKKALIVGCKDGSLKVFSMMSGAEEVHHKVHTDAVMCLHALCKSVITGSADSTVSVFSLESKSTVQKVDVIAPLQCCDVQFGNAYFGTRTGFLVVFKAQTVGGQLLLEQDHHPLKLTSCSILAVRVAKEGSQKVIILASRGEQITVREATTGNVLRTFDWCDTVHCIELYEGTPLVYCGTNTKSVKVMNFTTGENVSDCHLSRAIVQIAFLGSIMFAASFDGQVYVYDVEDKKRICIMQAAKGLIQSMIVHKLKIIVACNQNELKAISFPKELKKYFKKKNDNYGVGSDMASRLS